MKRAPLLAAAFATLFLGSTAVLAQHSGGHSGSSGGHTWGGHASGGHPSGGHYSGGRYYGGGGYYGWGPRYYYPYSVFAWPYYAAPYYSYPYPLYASRPPVIVERYYVDQAPEPPQYSYEERSYAQVVPPEPKRPAAPPPAPRMERITLSAKELFAFDESKLRPPQPRLDEIADLMKRNPRIDNVRITGYTDRIGTDSYNMKLSQRRAASVKNYLVGKGVEASRLVAVGKGEADPVVQCNDKKMADLIKCLEPNRRVEVEQITVERRVP
jgi:outer membrane protein OmpA-like peptidoglycan-associated protein